MHGIRTYLPKGRQFILGPFKYGKLGWPKLSNPALVINFDTMYFYVV